MFTIDMGNMPGGAVYHVVSVDNLVPLPSGGHVYHVSLDLASWDGTSPLSSTALSSTLPDPNLFQERSIYISGALGGAYFQIMAQLDSMQTVSGVASRPGLYTVDARIVEVYDPSWTLQGTLNPDDPINGTYQLDPGVQDRDPYPETAWYEHALMEGYGFSLTAGGRTFVTDSSTYPVNVFVQDNGGFDVYEVSNYGGTAGPDLRVNDIFMHLGDPSGQALSSTDLIQTPEVSRFMGPKDLMITGSRPDGSGYFHIRAEVLSIGVGGEPASALTLLPGDTQLLPGQGIDLGILLKPGYKPSSGPGMPLTVRVNGYRRDDILYGCHPFGGTDETGYFSICRDAELLLDPALPESRITIDVLMDDNTSQSGTITWELLKP